MSSFAYAQNDSKKIGSIGIIPSVVEGRGQKRANRRMVELIK